MVSLWLIWQRVSFSHHHPWLYIVFLDGTRILKRLVTLRDGTINTHDMLIVVNFHNRDNCEHAHTSDLKKLSSSLSHGPVLVP